MKDLVTRARIWAVSPGYRDMTLRQIALLGILCDDPGPHTVRAAAAKLNASKPVVVRGINAFEQLGLARRVADPDDRRSIFLEATALGRQVRVEIAEATS